MATRLLTSGQAAFGCSMWRVLLNLKLRSQLRSESQNESETVEVRRFSRNSWESGDDVDLDSVAYGFMASQARANRTISCGFSQIFMDFYGIKVSHTSLKLSKGSVHWPGSWSV